MVMRRGMLLAVLAAFATAQRPTQRGVGERMTALTAAPSRREMGTVATAEPEIDAVQFGTAGNYAVLASTGITTTPGTTITGDIATSPIGAA